LLRGQLAKFGIIENKGIENLRERRALPRGPDIAHILETALGDEKPRRSAPRGR